MAWELKFSGSGQRCDFAEIILIGEFSIVFSGIRFDDLSSNHFIMGHSSSTSSWIGKFGTSFTARIGGSSASLPILPTVGVTYDIEVSRDAAGLITISEPILGSGTTTNNSTVIFNQLARFSTRDDWVFIGGMQEVSVDSVTPIHDWDATASDHSGSTGQPILIDTVGGNDATGVNFPSFDASVWVNLGGSGISIDVDESGPAFTDAINTTLSANITSTITEVGPSFTDAISVTISSLTVQASIAESGPVFTDSSSITITPSININAAISEFGPSFTDDISASLSTNIVAAIAELGPSFVDSISISITKEIDINIAEVGPSFTDNIIASIPITITLNPKKIIRVKRKSNTVRIKRKSNIIRVS